MALTAAHASHICRSRAYAHPVLLWPPRLQRELPTEQVRTGTNPTQSQTSPAALVIYSLNCLSPARISYSRPTRRLIASLSPAPPHAPPFSNRRAINPRRGGQHSTVNHHRKASKAAHSSLKSIAYRHHRPSAVSTVSGRIRVLSLAVSYPYVIYVYLRTLNNASVGLGSYASVWCAGHAERASRR